MTDVTIQEKNKTKNRLRSGICDLAGKIHREKDLVRPGGRSQGQTEKQEGEDTTGWDDSITKDAEAVICRRVRIPDPDRRPSNKCLQISACG